MAGGTVGNNQLLIQTGVNTTALLSLGTSGQFLRSNGASLPTWTDVRGLQMSFGGLGNVSGYLQPNRWADPSAVVVSTSGPSTKWRVPFSGSVTAISSSVTTSPANTTLNIVKNGIPLVILSNVASASTNYQAITAQALGTGDYIELIIGTATCGVCLFTLYFS